MRDAYLIKNLSQGWLFRLDMTLKVAPSRFGLDESHWINGRFSHAAPQPVCSPAILSPAAR